MVGDFHALGVVRDTRCSSPPCRRSPSTTQWAHDGVYLQPHILEQVRQGGEVVERVAPKSRGKIASDKNIKIMQDLLRGVVEDRDGTAHRACYDPDLRLAGKTGTAQYNYGRGEPMQYMVSFAGYFPHDDRSIP